MEDFDDPFKPRPFKVKDVPYIIGAVIVFTLLVAAICGIYYIATTNFLYFITRQDCDLCDYYLPIWTEMQSKINNYNKLTLLGGKDMSIVCYNKVIKKNKDYPPFAKPETLPAFVYYSTNKVEPQIFLIKDKTFTADSLIKMIFGIN